MDILILILIYFTAIQKKLKNVVLLPHIGSATIEGRVAMGEKVIINIKTVADGHTPPDLVLETLI